MGWVRRRGGRYYIRYRWADGRCVSEYFGRGPTARAVADDDRLQRLEREAAIVSWDTTAARVSEAERQTRQYLDASKLLVQAALVARGFHLHQLGEWRRRCE